MQWFEDLPRKPNREKHMHIVKENDPLGLGLAFKDLSLVDAKHVIKQAVKIDNEREGVEWVIAMIETCRPLRQKSLYKFIQE
ncbi:hypothetical protein EON64_08540 [archaeon]|nr:MAG: hypothetical protein EON64_08540 [archaeon]